jgi:hypothetical protein
LLKNTSETHADYKNLLSAIDQLKKFTLNVNEKVRETEHHRKFTETVADSKKYIGFDQIVAPHRSLIYESDVSVKVGDREYSWMLLFSDLLVFASVTGKKRFVEDKISLELTWFEDLGTKTTNFLS